MDYMATLRVALRALKVNAMRSTLTMLGIIIGVAAVITMIAVAHPPDQTIRTRRVPFTVIGILEKKGQTHFGQDQDDIVMVPIATHRNRLFGAPQGKLRRVGRISVKV